MYKILQHLCKLLMHHFFLLITLIPLPYLNNSFIFLNHSFFLIKDCKIPPPFEARTILTYASFFCPKTGHDIHNLTLSHPVVFLNNKTHIFFLKYDLLTFGKSPT